MARHTVRSAIANSDAHDFEVVLVDDGLRPTQAVRLEADFMGEPRVRIARLPRRRDVATATNAALATAAGDFVVLLRAGVLAHPRWLTPLLRPLRKDPHVLGVQGLLLEDDGTVSCAGYAFLREDSRPLSFLAGHPVEDAEKVAGQDFHAVSSDALAMRREDIFALGGLDTTISDDLAGVDLCLRAKCLRRGRFAVACESVFTAARPNQAGGESDQKRSAFLSRWQLPSASEEWHHEQIDVRRGLDARTHVRRSLLVPRKPKAAHDWPGEFPPLRWSIHIASTPGAYGDFWADTHFARGLAKALKTLGQDPVVFRRGAHRSTRASLTDVALTIRGLQPGVRQPDAVNILWVISHPELVRPEEIRDFDLIFASSDLWARETSRAHGVPVAVLHQATDPELFHPQVADRAGLGAGPIVFIGNGRQGGHGRRVVEDALAARVDLHVYGRNWQNLLPPGVLKGEYVRNECVARHYATASVVLNDHWKAMAELGFVNNRVFDAVATGARVVSDPVEGLADLFGDVVRPYKTVEELAWLCSAEGLQSFPPADELSAIAVAVADAHSFVARARTLLTAVTNGARLR